MRVKQITYKQRKLIEAMAYVGVHEDFEGDTFGQAGKYIREHMEEYDRLKWDLEMLMYDGMPDHGQY